MDRLARSFRLGIASALLLGTSTLSEGVKAQEDYRITNDVVLRGVRVSPVKPGTDHFLAGEPEHGTDPIRRDNGH
jgi:hypothetical protein